MSTAQQLNTRFGIDGQLGFREDASGLIVAEIGNPLATASLCLQGAHLMTWQPRSQAEPVIWLSRDVRLAAGKSIRGGVPVCWPWFGAHASEHSFPAHGYARTVPWQVIESGTGPGGATRLMLRLTKNEKTRAYWPHDARLELAVSVGEKLRMELSTENNGGSGITISEALHAYFRIGDIGAVRVTGLAGCDYWDKAGGSTLKKQDGIIRFAGETDRVYINTAAECAIEDDALKRRIHVAKSGSHSTVVWTPWTAKADKMGDLGQPVGWREMLCVESANAIGNALHVAAGTKHTLMVEYRAEPLQP
ncbi:MAG: D-hexose-6-phosphate mutarotase [Gallionellales bacterium RIFCSPLOWO2_12_FULL_59_22]|nr:MAG: D-hexose-6-phosphate mutarotase [Gallionellales bacterium RIFCSPLOWO2_02_FULL_59_110]OGT01333.1 MAG: D-hexose-6-phosphate mutarotase [Gallionellales bacterium RIFCSPLOWO2_02_58_13]OGT13807.1 MAG: D-hexose-6-phosphate mutarotase [Gallionellales bacterium RIFCSPLOWO2_12_FULL_59_22]